MAETKTTMQLQEEWLKEARIRLAGLKAMKASKEDIHAAEYKVAHHVGMIHDMNGMSN